MSQVSEMIKDALENQLHQIKTLKLLTMREQGSTDQHGSSSFSVRSFKDDEILSGRKNFKAWKRMVTNDLDGYELSPCIESVDGNSEWSEAHRKKLKA